MPCVRKKKNGKYEIIVSLGYNVENKKIIKTMTYTPDENMTEKAAKKEAERQAVLFEEKVKNGEYGNSKIKLVDFINDIWFKEYMKGKSPSTIYRYKILSKLIIQQLGHLPLDKIRPLHIQKFKNYLSTAKSNVAIKDKDGSIIDYKTYAPKTQLHYFRCLSTILNDAYKLEMIKENPVAKISAPRVPRKKPQFLDIEQTRHILELLKNEDLKYQVAINILIFTGIRRGELLGLTWDAIDWKNSEIRIEQNTIYVNKKIYTKDPKTETSNRIVDIPSNILALLKEFRVYQNKERLRLGDQWVNTNRIMTQWNGKIMHPDTISQWWKKFQIKNGIENVISLHKLRHTYATLMLDIVDLTTVSESLGHSDISTTNIYAHALKERKKGAVEKLQEELIHEQPSGENAI
jgi:integrase